MISLSAIHPKFKYTFPLGREVLRDNFFGPFQAGEETRDGSFVSISLFVYPHVLH